MGNRKQEREKEKKRDDRYNKGKMFSSFIMSQWQFAGGSRGSVAGWRESAKVSRTFFIDQTFYRDVL